MKFYKRPADAAALNVRYQAGTWALVRTSGITTTNPAGTYHLHLADDVTGVLVQRGRYATWESAQAHEHPDVADERWQLLASWAAESANASTALSPAPIVVHHDWSDVLDAGDYFAAYVVLQFNAAFPPPLAAEIWPVGGELVLYADSAAWGSSDQIIRPGNDDWQDAVAGPLPLVTLSRLAAADAPRPLGQTGGKRFQVVYSVDFAEPAHALIRWVRAAYNSPPSWTALQPVLPLVSAADGTHALTVELWGSVPKGLL